MRNPRKFLTAEWKNLVMLNYAVDASLLEPYVPAGVELDSFEEKTYLSLVGFQFNNTRLFGYPVPFHQAFEEVNLRFYVRHASKRGVVFIREFVPKYAVAAVARLAFNENYSCVPMSHRIESGPECNVSQIEYARGSGLGRCSIKIETEGASFIPPEGSAIQFITEHYWGYATQIGGGCLEYEVQHAQWGTRIARRAEFTGDLVGLYGEEIARVLSRNPDSAFLAEGSPVTVFQGTMVK
jgi:Uncharacterized conserved protein